MNSPSGAAERDLHAAIMDLQCAVPTIEPPNGRHDALWASGYKHGHRDARHAAAELAAAADASRDELVEALERVIESTHSHVDGRDLLAELHPRYMLDIKRRRDGVETWFQGDWLSNLWAEVKAARGILAKHKGV